jgi:DNA-binding phage protein
VKRVQGAEKGGSKGSRKKGQTMTITRDFKDTVKARADRDPEFRKALIAHVVNCFATGDVATMKVLLRDYIKATDGFEVVARAVQKSPKSLMRMLSPAGNPQVSMVSPVVQYAIKREGIHEFAPV